MARKTDPQPCLICRGRGWTAHASATPVPCAACQASAAPSTERTPRTLDASARTLSLLDRGAA